MLYFAIVLGALILGALSGIGGGVLIKPLFDAVTDFSAAQIGVYSASAVLAMSLVALARHAALRTPIRVKSVLPLSIGSILGGIAGDWLFYRVLDAMGEIAIKRAQAIALCIILLLVLVYMNRFREKRLLRAENPAWGVLAGLVLGMMASFLGIGGGPMNVAALCLVFSMDVKETTVNSLFIIACSQGTKLIKTFASGGVPGLDPGVLAWILPAAVLGALIGTWLNKRAKGGQVLMVYNLVLVAIILINVRNLLVWM